MTAHAARRGRSTDQAIPDVTETQVIHDRTIFDTDGYAAGNGFVIPANLGGTYLIGVAAALGYAPTTRSARSTIYAGGTLADAQVVTAILAEPTFWLNHATLWRLSAGEAVQHNVYHGAGAGVALLGGLLPWHGGLWLAKVPDWSARARATVVQSIPANAWTDLTLDTSRFDYAAQPLWSPAGFVAPATGLYLAGASLSWASDGNSFARGLRIVAGNVPVAARRSPSDGTANQGGTSITSGPFRATAGTVIKPQAWQSTLLDGARDTRIDPAASPEAWCVFLGTIA